MKFKYWLLCKFFDVYWYCGRCGSYVDKTKTEPCKCKKGPSPWHLCIAPK